MANPRLTPPTLSLAERDRRWARVRSLMRERGLDGLLVAGFRAREAYETYLSDDYNEGCVIFPLEGDPVVITWAHLRVMRARGAAWLLQQTNENPGHRAGHERAGVSSRKARAGGGCGTYPLPDRACAIQ